MKIIHYLVLLFLLLGMQQSTLVAAASVGLDSANTVERTACYHMILKKADQRAGHHPCCKVQCHCAANNCHAAGLIVAVSLLKQAEPVTVQSGFSYHAVIPQRIPASLFRPPIFS